MVLFLEDHVARDMTRARNMIGRLVGGKIPHMPNAGGGLHAVLEGDFDGLLG